MVNILVNILQEPWVHTNFYGLELVLLLDLFTKYSTPENQGSKEGHLWPTEPTILTRKPKNLMFQTETWQTFGTVNVYVYMCQCVKVYLNCKILLSDRLTLKIGWIFRHWQNMFLKYAKGVQPNQFIKLWIAKTIKFDIRSYFLIFMRVIFPCRSKIY